MAFNSDMQEDKERLFDTIDTVKGVLGINTKMLKVMKVKKERMRDAIRGDFSNATDMADYLARHGIPFRQAHEIVGAVVLYCIEHQKALEELTLGELQQFSEIFMDDIYAAISPENCVNTRASYGGTAPERVVEQIAIARSMLADHAAFWV